MKKRVFTIGFVLFSFMLPLKATAQRIDKIYTFGDSLSDPGNAYNATRQLSGTGIPPSPYFQGRFSNGIVWVEYLGQQLGLNPTPYTALSPGKTNASNGINYAFGGANTDFKNTLFPGAPLPGLLTEVGLFTASLATTKQSADPNALYIIWAGANDYLSGSATNPQVPVKNITTAVSSLIALGAKRIVVVNLPDLGKLPGTRLNSQRSSQLSALSRAHNSSLTQKILSQKLYPRANLVLLDVNTLFNTVRQFPAGFGLKNVTDSCLNNNTVCANPNQYLFWDAIHPTTAGHQLVEKLAYLVIQNTISQAKLTRSPSLRTVEAPFYPLIPPVLTSRLPVHE